MTVVGKVLKVHTALRSRNSKFNFSPW